MLPLQHDDPVPPLPAGHRLRSPHRPALVLLQQQQQLQPVQQGRRWGRCNQWLLKSKQGQRGVEEKPADRGLREVQEGGREEEQAGGYCHFAHLIAELGESAVGGEEYQRILNQDFARYEENRELRGVFEGHVLGLGAEETLRFQVRHWRETPAQ